MADKKLVLLDFWPSPFGMRVRIALEEKGIEYEYSEVNVADKSPLLLKMNPVLKKIPVLIDNGKPIDESLVIVHYIDIDEVWKNSPLLPQDSPYERATARFWADFIDKNIYDPGARLWRTKGEAKELAKKELIEHLKLLEGALGDKPYFGGESFGFTDVSFIPFASWFHVYESNGNFKIEDECPKLIGWVKRCMERESVSKVLPNPKEVYDFTCRMKKKLWLRRGIGLSSREFFVLFNYNTKLEGIYKL